MASDRPTLFALHPRVEHHVAVLTLEAFFMEISVQGANSGCRALSLLRYNRFVAH